jgi:putative membrane protein
MFRSAAVYRDNPYDENAEFYQAAPYAEIWNRGQDNIAKGALIGALAGLGAGFVMTQFQKLWAFAQDELAPDQKTSETPKHRQAGEQEQRNERSDDATVKLANRLSESLFDHSLSRKEKDIAGPAVHYGFSVMNGALYGAFAEVSDVTTAGFGTAFGAALFVGADEIAIPALKLSPFPNKVSPDKHLYGLVSHLVYGASLEGLRRALLRLTR